MEYTDLPKRDKCMAMLAEHGVSGDLLRHTLTVNKVATFLAKKLVENQELIDLQLVDRASLLHDIGKGKEDHARVGANILRNMGYPKIADVIEKHRVDFILNDKFSNWEELIVYYADKRVKEDKIVSLEEDLDSIKLNHPEHAGDIDIIKPKVKELERQMFEHLKISPEQLKDKVMD